MDNNNEKNEIADKLKLKQDEFNACMDIYEKKSIYKLVGKMVSLVNVSLQTLLLFMVIPQSIGPVRQIISIVIAFIAADFVNGLVHMIMDNNDNYKSMTGPLIAAFHLHHKTPQYKINRLIQVYYNETGSKVWIVPFLVVSAVLIGAVGIGSVAAYALAYFGILSSVAEVTHYRCHVPDSRLGKRFSGFGIFLTKRHHARHHIEDNVNYAFLNGLTDPFLNFIARRFYPGYKNTTDRHYARYTGMGTDNR